MKYVLDSNIVIGALNGVPAVQSRLAVIEAIDVSIPVVVIAELVYGAHRSARRDENLAKVNGLRERFPVLPVSDGVVDRYGAVRAGLESRGTSKSDFDLLIACTALDAGATLVSHDQALLDGAIEELKVEDWLATA